MEDVAGKMEDVFLKHRQIPTFSFALYSSRLLRASQ